MKLKLCRNVHNISFYKNCVFVAVAHVPSSLWQLKISYNGKSESRPLFLSHYSYFDESFAEMFLEKSSTKYMNFVQITEFDWLPLVAMMATED